MTTTTQTLASWLLEQIAADEAVMAQVTGALAYHQSMLASQSDIDRLTAEAVGPPRSIALAFATGQAPSPVGFDPAHVLAVCAAHRAIVGLYALKWRKVTGRDALGEPVDPYDRGALRALERVLANLAQPYADRPGWREEWAA